VVGVVLVGYIVVAGPPVDVHAYWVFSPADPYRSLVGSPDAFLYSPVAGLALLPFHLLPFEVFRVLMLLAELGALSYLVGPWALALVPFYPVLLELAAGNIQILLAAAVVFGFRYPGAWSFVLLTKVTPGVGLLWFVVRREWHSLALAHGVTALLAAISALIVPGWWPAWFATLAASVGHAPAGSQWFDVPLASRLAVSALIVAWGGLTDRRWTVPLVAMLSLPVVWWSSLAMLAAPLGLVLYDGGRDASDAFVTARQTAPRFR
jgi:hypothetical protein